MKTELAWQIPQGSIRYFSTSLVYEEMVTHFVDSDYLDLRLCARRREWWRRWARQPYQDDIVFAEVAGALAFLVVMLIMR